MRNTTTLQHTLGPMRVDSCRDANGFWTIRPDDGTKSGDTDRHPIATVYTTKKVAQFLATAPELLEALKSLFEHCAMVHNKWGDDCNNQQADAAIAAARAAIAQAEGR